MNGVKNDMSGKRYPLLVPAYNEVLLESINCFMIIH